MNGQTEVKLNGQTWHVRFGVNSMERFCEYYGINLSDLALSDNEEEEKNPFRINYLKALKVMYWAGFYSGNTRKDLPETFEPDDLGNWLDEASEKTILKLQNAYLSSSVLGKRMTGK